MNREKVYSRQEIEEYLEDLAENLWSYLKLEPPVGWHRWLKNNFVGHFEVSAIDDTCDCRNCLWDS